MDLISITNLITNKFSILPNEELPMVPAHVVAVAVFSGDLVLDGLFGGLPPALANVTCLQSAFKS